MGPTLLSLVACAAQLALVVDAPTQAPATVPDTSAAPSANEGAVPGSPTDSGGEAGIAPTHARAPGPDDSSDQSQVEPEQAQDPQPEPQELNSAGVAGQLVDRDDPNANRATSDLEGEALDARTAGVPDRLRPLQAAGWWTLFGTAVLGTTGGVLAGLAERQEDEAIRATQMLNLSTGASLEYSEISEQYEQMIDRGEKLSWGARGFFIVGAATAITSITLFALDRKRHAQEDRVSVIFGPGSASVRF